MMFVLKATQLARYRRLSLTAAALLAGLVASLTSATGSSAQAPQTPSSIASAATVVPWTRHTIHNASFTHGTHDWFAGGVHDRLVTTHRGHLDRHAVALETSIASTAILDERVPAVLSTVRKRVYRVSAWVRTDTPGTTLRLRLRERNGAAKHNTTTSPYRLPDRDWHHMVVRHAAKSDGSTLGFRVMALNLRPGQHVVIDDVALWARDPKPVTPCDSLRANGSRDDKPSRGVWGSDSHAVRSPSIRVGPCDRGFRSLAVGAGGFVTGLSFSDDGSVRVVRTDTGGGYRWARDRWVLDVSSRSLPASDVEPGLGAGVLALAVAPSDGSVVYMAFNNAVYRSSDGAKTWSKVLSGVSTAPNDDFRATGPRLTVDPRNPDVVYYGSQLDGMYVTVNGGSSWDRVATTVLPAGLVVDLDDKSAAGSLTRPTDTMEKNPHLASGGINAIAVDPSGGTVAGHCAVVYAASYGNGVYMSSDGGGSWSKISPAAIAAVGYLRVLSNGDVLVTSHSNPTDLSGSGDVWRFRDGAWSKITPATSDNWKGIAADPTAPGRLALMGQGGQLALSQDYGSTWSLLPRTQSSNGDVPWLAWALNGGTNFMTVGEIAFDPVVSGRLWFAEGTGVWYADLNTSAATVEWHSQSRGLEQLVPTDVIAPPGGKPLLTAWDRPIFRSDDPDTYPTHYGPINQFGSAWSIDWSVSDPDYVVADVASHQWPSDPSTSGYSTNGGKTWTPFPTIPLGSTNAVTTFGFGSMAVSSPGNIVWVPAYGKRPEYTKDGGKTWTPITLPGVSDYSLVDNQAYYVNRQVIAADKTTPGTFYLYVLNTGTYRTTDGGQTWTQMSDNTAMQDSDYSWNLTLKAVPGHAGELYLTPGKLGGTTTQPFKHSTDAGRTWTTVPGVTGVTAFGYGKPFPRTHHPALFIAGYVHGRYGIYRSTNNAHTWTYLTDYPAGRTPTVTAIDGDKTITGRLYLAITGSGWTYGGSARSKH
jgi:hypothetical protein